MRSGKFTVTTNQCFDQVISACSAADRKDQDGTWITSDMIAAYIQLHELGIVHSTEVWLGDNLVGGLYGVQTGNIFCGESMFSVVSNASKMALIHLCSKGYELIDCQMHTPHLESMGARIISREEYLALLTSAI